MDDIIFRSPMINELSQVSAQIAESYKATYKNMMSDSYLDLLSADNWVPILQKSLLRGDICIIAEVNGKIAGSAVFGKNKNKAGEASWHAIYLLPHFIGKGIGHRLCAEVEAAMKAQQFTCSTLEVLTENHRAIKFYVSHGYSVANTFFVEENNMTLECYTMKKQLA